MTIYPQGKISSSAANGILPALIISNVQQLVHEIVFAPDPTATGKTYVCKGTPDLVNYTNVLHAFPPYPTTAVAVSCPFRIKDGGEGDLLNPVQFNVGAVNGADGMLISYVID
ncbi:MAG: hypothetical protein WA324_19900 [Bryobacteraceae bacterium]